MEGLGLMDLSARNIETGHGEMLFSPVLANALEPGDLIIPDESVEPPWGGTAQRVAMVRRLIVDIAVYFADETSPGPILLGVNEPVMRAVGARASRII
jgi:hypothetical protein